MSQEADSISGQEEESVWRFVQFYITVPFPMAFPENHYFAVWREEVLDWMPIPIGRLALFLPDQFAEQVAAHGRSNFVFLHFVRYPIDHPSPYDRSLAVDKLAEFSTYPAPLRPLFGDPIHDERDIARIDSYETIIKAATCMIDDGTGNAGKMLHEAFDGCVDELALIVEAYYQTAKEIRPGFVTRASIIPMVPAVVFDPVTDTKEVKHIMAGSNFPLSPAVPKELEPKQIQEIFDRVELDKRGEPYAIVRRWQRIARRAYLLEGNYALAVVGCHTAGEVFFDALLLRMAWEEITFWPNPTLTREDVVKWFSYPHSLRWRLCNLYHPRLKGSWDCGTTGNPIHTWIETVAGLRNKVVHGGYQPTQREANDALVALDDVETYVEQLIGRLSNVQRYTFAIFMMLGPVGLKHQQAYTKNIRSKIEGESSNWQQSFRDFRRWVIDQLP